MPGQVRHSGGPKTKALERSWRLVKVLFNEFKVFLVCITLAYWISTFVLYFIYPEDQLPRDHHTLLGTAYDTLLLMFFETPIPFVNDWRLVPIFFGLPILGLIIIAEGVVNLGNLLIQHRRYSKEWQKMMAATFENHIVVCGLGNVGRRVVEQLRKFGEDVVCIENKENSQFIHEMSKFSVPVLHGDATNDDLLEQASIRRAKALIAVTDNDLANLEIALSARELCPGLRVVVRMFDQKLAKKIEKSFDIHCAFSTSALSAPVFAQAALSANILSSFEFGGMTINAFQLLVDDAGELKGMTVDQVRQKHEATILMHERNTKADWNPPPNTVLETNDRLLVMTDSATVHKLLQSQQVQTGGN